MAEAENIDDDVDLYEDVFTLPVDTDDIDGSGSPIPAPENNGSQSQEVNTVSSAGSQDSMNEYHRDNGNSNKEYQSYGHARKHQACVGNLTWWTTDEDIKAAATDIGISDFIDVKFYDNRMNGQSKGYCMITVGSETSLRFLHEKLSKKELHGQVPIVAVPSKQNISNFDSQTKGRQPPMGGGGQQGHVQGNMGGGRGGYESGQGGMMGQMRPRGPGPMHNMQGPPMYGGPRMMMGNNGPMNGPPMNGPPRGMPPMGMGPPGMMRHQQPGGPQGYPPPHIRMNSMPPVPGGGSPRMPMMMNGGPPGMGPMGMNRGPGPVPPPGMMDSHGPPRHEWDGPPRGPPHPGNLHPGAPAPHINPAFFQNAGVPMPGRNDGNFSSHESQPGGYRESPPSISGKELEEIMTRNKTVSSSAISRAVTDAASGDFPSAIETLVTAISLIKNSKVTHDARCTVLIDSLQDTLHGIESKSYGTPRKDRSRSRDRHRRGRRSRSREIYRDRSRERDLIYEYEGADGPARVRDNRDEREYRDRRRDDRSYYEDRYRERERERPREVEKERRPEREVERERVVVRERDLREPGRDRMSRH